MISKSDKNFAVKVSKDKLIVGYKGKSFLEQGYVYAPYTPMIVSPILTEKRKKMIDVWKERHVDIEKEKDEKDPIKLLMRKIGYQFE